MGLFQLRVFPVSMGYNRRCPGKSRDGPRRSPAALLRSLQRLNSTELLPSPSTPNPDPEGSQPGRSHALGLVLDRDRAEARKGTGIWGNDVFRSIVEPFRARPGERGAAEAAPAPSLLYLPAINTGLQIPINYPQIPGWNGFRSSPSTATGSGLIGSGPLRAPGVVCGKVGWEQEEEWESGREGGRQGLNALIAPRLSRERKYPEKTGRNSLGSAPVKGPQMPVFFQVGG